MRSYEELSGGLGHTIRYRPTRHRARDLVAGQPLELRVQGRRRLLLDLAMNGVAFRLPRSEPTPDIGQVVTVELGLDGTTQFAGDARVARVEAAATSLHVGLSLLTGFIDVPALVQKRDELALDAMLQRGPWCTFEAVPAAYRSAIERMVHFLQFYRQLLDSHEARRRTDTDTDTPSGAALGLAAEVVDTMRDQWREVRGDAARAAVAHVGHPKTIRAMKEYTEAVVTSLLVGAPMVRQGYEKPLGYPGDFQEMKYVYRNTLEGPSAFHMVMHKLGCEEPLAAGVRTRKDLVVRLTGQEHRRVLAARGEQATFSVTSLACGPAVDAREYIEGNPTWTGHARWVMVDQEQQALSQAYDGVYRALASCGSSGEVSCLYLSFSQIMTEAQLAFRRGPQDFIYASGLFDYIGVDKAQRLIEVLVDNLEPGGLLAVGNALADAANPWFAEFVLDWTLLYRRRDEMLNLGARVADRVEMEVVAEASDAYWFLLLRKVG